MDSSEIIKDTQGVPQGFVFGLILDVMYRKLSSMLKILLDKLYRLFEVQKDTNAWL